MKELLHSAEGDDVGIVDVIATQQGPNYSCGSGCSGGGRLTRGARASQLRSMWRRPTWTVSVTKNRILAAGYYGARAAGLEVFEPDTMSVLMTALLVHDLNVDTPMKTQLGLTRGRDPRRLLARPVRHQIDAAIHRAGRHPRRLRPDPALPLAMEQDLQRKLRFRVSPHASKVEKKGRTQAELDLVIEWLTGFNQSELSAHLAAGTTFEDLLPMHG